MGFNTYKYEELSNLLQEFMEAVKCSVFWKMWLTNHMSNFSSGVCFKKSVITKKVMTDMSHYIDMYFIPNFPKLISFGFFILFPDAVVKRSFTAAPRA